MFRSELLIWVKGWGYHVVEEALSHLAGDGAFIELGLQVHAAEEYAALAEAGFEEEAEFTVLEPVIDDLDDGAQLVGEGIHGYGGAGVDEVPPLPIGVGVGWEGCEGGVFGVTEDSEGMGGLALGPCGIPEDGGEAHFDIAGDGGGLGQEEDIAALVEVTDSGGVEFFGDEDLCGGGGEGFIGVDPDIPVIFDAGFFKAEGFEGF